MAHTLLGREPCLMRYKDGDANVRSVWLCSRNDAMGNVVVMGAAIGVWGVGHFDWVARFGGRCRDGLPVSVLARSDPAAGMAGV
jgi:hypothetical protein